MNSFFDGYLNSKTPLFEFIEQYEKTIASRRNAKESKNLVSMTTILDFTNMNILKVNVGRVYCRNTFKIFQGEFSNILQYQDNNQVVKEGVETTYEVDLRHQYRLV